MVCDCTLKIEDNLLGMNSCRMKEEEKKFSPDRDEDLKTMTYKCDSERIWIQFLYEIKSQADKDTKSRYNENSPKSSNFSSIFVILLEFLVPHLMIFAQ